MINGVTGWTDVHVEVVAINEHGEPKLWKTRFGLPPTTHYFNDVNLLLNEVKEIYHLSGETVK